MHAIAHAACGDGQHPPELAAPEDSDDSSRRDGFGFRHRGIGAI
jgi:hypothetical protein